MIMSLIEQLDALRIAKDLRTPIERLMRALDEAVDEEEVAREAQMQIEFVQAMEAARKLRGPQVEALYILFDDAVQVRLGAL
jgi:CTP-dependent riboflavin kinase